MVYDELNELVPVELLISIDVYFSEQVTQCGHHIELLCFFYWHCFCHELHEFLKCDTFLAVLFEEGF